MGASAASANGRSIPARPTSHWSRLIPDPAKVAQARKLEPAYARAEADGSGAINVDGVLVDVATIPVAEQHGAEEGRHVRYETNSRGAVQMAL